MESVLSSLVCFTGAGVYYVYTGGVGYVKVGKAAAGLLIGTGMGY